MVSLIMINPDNLIQLQRLFISTKTNLCLISISLLFRPLPIDSGFSRRTDLNGQLSRAVTTVVPQNPFNQMDNTNTTTNASLDTRPHFLIQDLPRNVSSPSKSTGEKKEEKTDQNPKKN